MIIDTIDNLTLATNRHYWFIRHYGCVLRDHSHAESFAKFVLMDSSKWIRVDISMLGSRWNMLKHAATRTSLMI